MRILLVDAYSSTDRPSEKFAEVGSIIREILQQQTELFNKEDIQIFERTHLNIDDFLYELNSSYTRKTAAKLFDYTDMVFIEGDVNLLPWHPFALKFNILLRMCIRAKKPLFASAFAMQSLIYLCASNIEKPIRVINGKGKGSSLRDAMNYKPEENELPNSDFFLDNATGDLYSFNYDSSEWIPKVNVGIHHRQAAEDFQSLGKYMIKQPAYQPKPIIDSSTRYLGRTDEDFCNTKKVFLQHWTILNVQREFKIPLKTHWDIHNFNFVNPNKTFHVLAESKAGPQVIFMDPYCVATYFPISRKYPETVQILKNFLLHNIKEVANSTGQNAEGIEKASIKAKILTESCEFTLNGPKTRIQLSSPFHNGTPETTKVKTPRTENSRPMTAKSGNFPHSGYAIKKTEAQIIFDNNTVRAGPPIQLKKSFETPRLSNLQYGNLSKPRQTLGSSSPSAVSFRPISEVRSFGYLASRTELDEINPQEQPKTEKSSSNHGRSSSPNGGLQSQSFVKQDRNEEISQKTRAEIRSMIYPDISKDLLPQDENWVPGNLSSKMKSRPITASVQGKKTIKLDCSNTTIFHSRYRKSFKSPSKEGNTDKPVIRCSSVYMTEEEQKRKEEKEAAQKTLGPLYFRFGGKATKPKYIPNYVGLTVTASPLNHKFRKVSKDKWLGGDMRLC